MFRLFLFIFCVAGAFSNECGVAFISEGLIVRGTEFARGSYPWMVALMYTNHDDKPPTYFCGGVLISEVHVLTGEWK
jgi:secreted trypsin-like serine protease